MKIKKLSVSILSYTSLGILRIGINGKRYEYEVSPYIYHKFKRVLPHNKGRALAIVRGCEI